MATYNKWWGLAALTPALAMVFTDQSVLPVALPMIQKHLQATTVQLEWTINAYLLVTAVFVLVCGKLSDHLGSRRAYCMGIAFFAIASILCSTRVI